VSIKRSLGGRPYLKEQGGGHGLAVERLQLRRRALRGVVAAAVALQPPHGDGAGAVSGSQQLACRGM
jgi:hypothetical protein